MALLRVVDRDGVEHEVEAKTGLKVMENLRELDYGVAAICGGMCSCATCHVYVDPDWQARLPAMMSDERELLVGAVRITRRTRACPASWSSPPSSPGLRVGSRRTSESMSAACRTGRDARRGGAGDAEPSGERQRAQPADGDGSAGRRHDLRPQSRGARGGAEWRRAALLLRRRSARHGLARQRRR